MTIDHSKKTLLTNFPNESTNLIARTTRLCMAYSAAMSYQDLHIYDYLNICVYLGVLPDDNGPKKRLVELKEFIDEVKKYTNDKVLLIFYHKIVKKLTQLEELIKKDSTFEDLKQKSDKIGRITKEISDGSTMDDFGPGLTALEVLAHLYT